MKNTIRAAAAAASLLGAMLMPLGAPGATSSTSQQPARFQMDTQFYDTYRPGVFEGKMALTVYPSGIVSGYYFPADDAHVRNVSGGVDGQNIWLDIGGAQALHLTGTLKNGTLTATAFIPGPDTWVFRSTKSVRQSS